jgi:hypothetical protein
MRSEIEILRTLMVLLGHLSSRTKTLFHVVYPVPGLRVLIARA